MNKNVSMVFLIMSVFILISTGVSSVNIDSVSVSEQDVFYSDFVGNDVVNLRVQVSSITQGNTATVTADFSNLGLNVCEGVENNTIILTDSGNGLWTGACNIGNAAAINTFKTGQILIDAKESNGGPTSPQKSLTIGIYNITIPNGNSCYRFVEGTTNFLEQNNFNSIDITLVVEASGSQSCSNSQGFGDNWLRIAKIRFLGVNLVDPAKASKISDILSVITINYSGPRTNQNNLFRIEGNSMPELSTNTFIELYNLPFLSQPTIVSDNSVPAQAITWTSNGFDSTLNSTTFNVSFTATPGFRGYTVTDNTIPIIAINAPSAGQNFNSTPQTIIATINGTRTEPSKILFHINNVLVGQYVYSKTNPVNTAGCIPISSNLEVYSCSFNISNNDGNYVLNVTAYDFGLGSGNVAMTQTSFVVQSQGPNLVVSSPQNSSTYEDTLGSMLKLSFSATDGNGLSKCWYTLNDDADVFIQNCTNSTTQLYLASGSYRLKLYANDTLGKTSLKDISFTVSDSNAPVIVDNTNATGSLKKTTTLKISTDEKAICKYDSLDVSFNKMKYSFTSEVLSHTASVNTSGNDTFTFFVRCEDLSENNNDNSLKIVLGKVEEVQVVIPVEEEITDIMEAVEMGLLKPGQHIVSVDSSNIPISDILIKTIGTADDVTITFIIPSKPSVKYGGNVYSYIDVVHGSLKDSLISEAIIKFKVDKNWLDDNDLNESEIFLFRYYNNKWTKLETSISKIGVGSIEYMSESPGLSIFAISTEEEIVVEKVQTTVATDNSSNVSTTSMVSEKEKSEARRSSVMFIIIGAVLFVLLIIYILAEINYRNGPPPIFPRERTPWAKIKKLFGQ